jgi:hypothetical protein
MNELADAKIAACAIFEGVDCRAIITQGSAMGETIVKMSAVRLNVAIISINSLSSNFPMPENGQKTSTKNRSAVKSNLQYTLMKMNGDSLQK